MTSAEFSEWRAFQRLEGPLGPEREDWRVAMLAAIVANANRDPKRAPRAYEPRDFMPDWAAAAGVSRPRLHPLEVADKVKATFARLAARGKGGAGR
jgi:Protein of unknown function (DUF4035)